MEYPKLVCLCVCKTGLHALYMYHKTRMAALLILRRDEVLFSFAFFLLSGVFFNNLLLALFDYFLAYVIVRSKNKLLLPLSFALYRKLQVRFRDG